ncbi:MAG: class II aldolase/adducin family protein [Planctomycetota bacterium]|jgi:rhamnose utilization protein RhaD (predicted bifunctional aldolase and dehydrogenase)
MDKILSQLIRISNTVGRDTLLIQGGGGNTSVKSADGKYMYIKASGTALKDMSYRKGWRRLPLDSVRSIIKDKSLSHLDTYNREIEVVNRLLLACDDKVAGGVRPSVETHLHAFLDKCVIHLHPVAVLAYACAKTGQAELQKLFRKEKYPPLWVPYADPGFMLAKKLAKLVEEYQTRFGKKPTILFLQKHGLLISANSPDAALQLLHRVINRCDSKLKKLKAGKIKFIPQKVIADAKQCVRRAFFEATGQYTNVSYFYDDAIAAFWRRREAKKMLAPAALTPDELLYANGPAMWVDECDSKKIAARLIRQITKGQIPSIAFLVKDVGLFIAGEKNTAVIVRDIVESSLSIRTNAFHFGGILSLSKKQQEFINQWEADTFRKKLASSLSILR